MRKPKSVEPLSPFFRLGFFEFLLQELLQDVGTLLLDEFGKFPHPFNGYFAYVVLELARVLLCDLRWYAEYVREELRKEYVLGIRVFGNFPSLFGQEYSVVLFVFNETLFSEFFKGINNARGA